MRTRSWFPVVAFVLSLSGCADCGGGGAFSPDPALGVHLLRVDGSEPETGEAVDFGISGLSLSAPDDDGGFYVLARHGAHRLHGRATLEGGQSTLVRVAADDTVTTLPPLPTGAVVVGRPRLLITTVSQHRGPPRGRRASSPACA